MHSTDDAHAVTRAIKAGDQGLFAELVGRHGRELQVHCYRMLGSFDEAEDLVQETFLRAWRRRETYAGRAPVRAWLYRIATNACLDALEKRPKVEIDGFDLPWLQPYPDALLADPGDEPDAVVAAKETVELAYLVAIQHLPPRSRAILILRDVLGWSAKQSAELLDASVASVNSALQRARSTLKEQLPAQRSEWAPGVDPSAAERDLVRRYIDATERGDVEALAAMMTEDVGFAMPPEPDSYRGRDVVIGAWVEGGFGTEGFGRFRCVETRANGQPAVACYVNKGDEDPVFRALAIDVLRIEGGQVADILTFNASRFASLGLPATL